MEICSITQCTGCTVCATVCPRGCISFTETGLGHFVPSVNESECINCKACIHQCPGNNSVDFKEPIKGYAAISADYNNYKTSSSGGVAAVLSQYIIDNGGVVYGCTGKQGYDICHIRVDNNDALHMLKGSKYVESRLGDTFSKIKEDLVDNRFVLFIGTPCQCAGAVRLFGEYDNFFAVDLICHGVPPQKIFKEHLSKNIPVKPDEVSFRDGTKYIIKAYSQGDVIYEKEFMFDLYYISFLKALCYRKSCYNCEYATRERVTNITIGDFHGIKQKGELNDYIDGISAVLINDEKGLMLFNAVEDKLICDEHDKEEIISGNAQLKRPSIPHKNSVKFEEIYLKKSFTQAAKKCLLVNRVKYLILACYKKLYVKNNKGTNY